MNRYSGEIYTKKQDSQVVSMWCGMKNFTRFAIDHKLFKVVIAIVFMMIISSGNAIERAAISLVGF